MLQVVFRAMGSEISALLDNESSQADRALRELPGWFEEWEQVLSRFRPSSDLNRLNASAGLPVQVHPALWKVIQLSLDAALWTGGLVTPTMLNALERAGYDRSFELLQAVPSGQSYAPGSVVLELQDTSMDAIFFNPQERTITLPPGMKLDLGGIGKGWAAWQAMQRLQVFGPVLVDAGGDIAVSGVRANGSPWPITITDPLQLREDLDTLALSGCGEATSGIDYRRWRKNGAWKHHIIDPRTGEPAVTDLLSVTVVAPDTLKAEAAAKTVLIMGSQAGLEWLESQPSLAGILAAEDGRVIYSREIYQYLWS